MFPIVSELDPHVRPVSMEFSDWGELRPEDRPRPVIEGANGQSAAPSWPGRPDVMLLGGTGAKILHSLDWVFDCAEDVVLGVQDRPAWDANLPVLRDLARQFLSPFLAEPCIVQSTQISWTRRAVHRALFPGDIRTAAQRRKLEILPPGAAATLSFSWEGADRLEFNSEDLRWAEFRGSDSRTDRTARVSEAPNILLGAVLVRPFHRQRLGRVPGLDGRPLVSPDGQFPAIAERLHPIARAVANRQAIGRGETTQVIDQDGILDGQLVRFQRYHRPEKNGEILGDELVVTLERGSARVLEIGTEREVSGPEYAETFEFGPLGRWLRSKI